MKGKCKVNWIVIIAGVIIGAAAVLLSVLGNPKNMGFCIACFYRDIAGSVHLHNAEVVEYFRPEIVGMIAGACIAAFAFREFKGKGGSSPFTRFVLGAFMMIGSLVFLGCPLRMLIRLGGGDLNALIGLLGFAAGIGVGIIFIKKGFSLGRAYNLPKAEGMVFPVLMVVMFVLSLVFTGAFSVSEKGPGSMHAPVVVSLIAGIVVGVLCQRSRFCMAAGLRNTFLFGDVDILLGAVALFLAVLIGNLITGRFSIGFAGQPVAHSNHVWNFLGMLLCGWAATLLGGCPLRQTILAAEGNTDSAITVIGMITGAAFAHNFKLAGGADSVTDGVLKVGGPGSAGKIAVIIGFVVLLVISLVNSQICKKED